MNLLLSTTGCDRATAYQTSNKIIRHNGHLYIGWLDAPEVEGELFPIRLGIVRESTGTLENVITLGKVYDNHGGPALALDRAGHLHVLLGAHHHPFLHRWSATPGDPHSWSEPIALGPFATYPSLVADHHGTLHLLHRHMDERWQLWYRRKPLGKAWEQWVVIAIGPLPGYNHFMQSLSVGPDNALHAFFQFAYTDTGRSSDVRGRSAIYLTSEDSGNTWFNEGTRCTFPLTPDTAKPLHRSENLTIGTPIIDEQNQSWFHWVDRDTPGGRLLKRTGNDWQEIETGLHRFGFTTSRDIQLSRDPTGLLHLVLATSPCHPSDPGDPPTTPPFQSWHHPTHEIFHTTITPSGQVAPFTQLTPTDPALAHWLPTLEQWDWTRPQTSCTPTPAFAYTLGHTGGRGSNRNRTLTEVRLSTTPSPKE